MRSWLLLILILFSGCIDPSAVPVDGPSGFTWSYGQSMSPDFTGDGPSYPVLLLHQHADLSKKQAEEQRYVVCLVGGPEIPALPDERKLDMMACPPPVFDAATGRVYHANTTDWGGPAVALGRGCTGSINVFPDDGTIEYRSAAHDFLVALDGDDFVIDGTHRIRPGEVLKVDYWIDRGEEDDQRMVKVVFDNPGRWLYNMVGDPYDDPGLYPPAPPEQGSGLMATVDDEATDLESIVAPVWQATPGAVSIRDLRIVRTDRLTEVRIDIEGNEGTFQWYSAAHDDGNLRMLANHTLGSGPRILPDALYSWERLTDLPGGGELATSWRIVHQEVQPATAMPTLEAAPGAGICDPCLLRWQADVQGVEDWQWLPLATLGDAGWSILVEGDGADGTHRMTYLTR